MKALVILALIALAGCSTSGRPLPLVDKNAPTWALTPDYLEFGSLPQ